MGLALRKEKHHTYADYLQWPDDARYELIDGEAFLMSPAPLVEHQEVAGEVYYQLRNQLDGKPCRPLIAPLEAALQAVGGAMLREGDPLDLDITFPAYDSYLHVAYIQRSGLVG